MALNIGTIALIVVFLIIFLRLILTQKKDKESKMNTDEEKSNDKISRDKKTASSAKDAQDRQKLIKTQGLSSEQLVDQIRVLLDDPGRFNWDYDGVIQDTAKLFIDAGEKGTDILHDCLSDLFKLRTHKFDLPLQVTFKVIQHTKNERLINLLEKIAVEGRNLVEGYPIPPSWMPNLTTDIAGGGKYGWSDGIWKGITREIAQFLFEIIPQLPAELQREHMERLSQAINYHIESWKNIRERATFKESIDEEIDCWTSLKAKLPVE